MDLEEIGRIAKGYMDRNDIMHGWDHTLRVYNMCLRIGRDEGADLEVLGLAALLHDTGIHMDRENHEKASAKIAGEVLKGYEKMDQVVYCIESHRFSKGMKAETLEARILQDSDRLDAMGAMGITRNMVHSGFFRRPVYLPEKEISRTYNGKSETSIDHFYEKLLKIKDTLNTETAKRIAEHRHAYMENFLEEFFAEWDGRR